MATSDITKSINVGHLYYKFTFSFKLCNKFRPAIIAVICSYCFLYIVRDRVGVTYC